MKFFILFPATHAMLTANYFYDLPDELQHKILISAINADIRIIYAAQHEKYKIYKKFILENERRHVGVPPIWRGLSHRHPSMGIEALVKLSNSIDEVNRLKNLVNLKHVDLHSRAGEKRTTYKSSSHAALFSLDWTESYVNRSFVPYSFKCWREGPLFSEEQLRDYLTNNNKKSYKSWKKKRLFKAILSF